eukprot:TRINITY_DN27870_c1_g1_i2.p2 TRINITY_DN27870_c1_g1~~TRINITY_DN27870_c1_g1_i2.p2  ORF type:complete len:142 (+),score=15.84 TRINITY_DN27870_c1_g1_i2:66-491(+)
MAYNPSRPIPGFPPGITRGLPVTAFFLGSGSRCTALDDLRAWGNRTLAWQSSLSRSAPQNADSSSSNDNIQGVAQPRQEAVLIPCSTERFAEVRVASCSTELPTSTSFYPPHRAQQGAQPTSASFISRIRHSRVMSQSSTN